MTDLTCSFSQPANNSPISFVLTEDQITAFPLHKHSMIEVMVCLRGHIDLLSDGEVHSLEENNFALISPHTTHGYKTEVPSDSLCIVFSENIFEELENVNIFNINSKIHVVQHLTSDQINLLNDCLSNITFYHATNDVALLTFYCKIFLTHLFRLVLDNEPTHTNNTLHSETHIDNILRYIQLHYREKVTLEDLAANVNINRFSISKLINQHFGCTLPDIINQYRIFDACQLLINTNDSILEISDKIGYGSLNSFNRNFIRRFGVTPNEFRKQKKSRSTFFTP